MNATIASEESVIMYDLADVLEARAVFYEMLASLYFEPLKQEQIDRMAQIDLSPYAAINESFAQGLKDMSRYLAKRNTGTRLELAVDFTSAFAGTKTFEGRSAVPYKSVFTSEEGLLYQAGYREVFSAYKREAVKKQSGLDYPDDHLSFMCEFMALLSRRALASLNQNEVNEALHDFKVSLDFLRAHIASWFDDFADLSNLILKTRFYKGVLEMTRGFFACDDETLCELIEQVGAKR
jgi:putative dimethyl sulfoxide reductase chaperone